MRTLHGQKRAKRISRQLAAQRQQNALVIRRRPMPQERPPQREQYAWARARKSEFKKISRHRIAIFLCFSRFLRFARLDGQNVLILFWSLRPLLPSSLAVESMELHRLGNHCDGKLFERRTRRCSTCNVAELPAVCREISGISIDFDQIACYLVSTRPS